MLSEVGIDLQQVSQPLYRVPGQLLAQLVTLAEKATGDNCFCLRVVDYIHPTTYGALSFALYSSSDIRSFCERLSRFYAFVTTNHLSTFLDSNDGAKMVFRPADPNIDNRIYRSLLTGDCGVILRILREISSPEFNFQRLDIACEEPPDALQRYQEYFNCEVKFEAEEYAIDFRADDIDTSFPAANAELALQNDQIVMKMLADTVKGDLVMQVRAKLVEMLPSGECSKDDIAKELFMSVRTLHNKLEKLGKSYQQVLDETREELAGQYMQQQNRSISEIAYLLGFSDCSNFSRAFKRWTGVSPSQFRSSNAEN